MLANAGSVWTDAGPVPITEQTILIGKLPPSTNSLTFNAKWGGRAKTDKYAAWLRSAGWELEAQKPQAFSGDVAVEIWANKPNKRKRDLDNLAKPILDLLVAHRVIDDDSDVQSINMRWDGLLGLGVTITGTLSGKPRK